MATQEIIPLGRLLATAFPPERPVCLQPLKTWGDLRRVSAALQSRLPVGSAKPWLLAVDSAFGFVAALLACWQAKVPVLISPDTQPGTLAQLQPLLGGCVTDRVVELSGIPMAQVDQLSDVDKNSVNQIDIVVRADDELALELFTSGSTGERKRVAKTFAQLDHELVALQQRWGSEVRGHAPWATVSHLHIYGLLFKVLWPLCRGDAFHDQSFFFWEELLEQIPVGPVTIVSSPAHLRHLPQAARQVQRDWTQTRIFSSGGPLPAEVASAVKLVCGQAPMEVYGSTETGGIACRQQQDGVAIPWEPLPGVACKIEAGLLAIRSDRLVDSEEWFVTSDRAETDGASGFHLLGRNDRIVKILEKRVSLDEMEAALSGHPAVEAARAVLLPPEKESSRELLGMVIELTDAGKRNLTEKGKAGLAAELKHHLQDRFEAVTLPRRWRWVDKMPRDAQGKINFNAVAELFAARPTQPEVLQREPTASGCLVSLRVPAHLAYLEGHFPEIAIVPGVCQLKWVVEEIGRFCGEKKIVVAMDAVKFHDLLIPGQEFHLEFGLKPDTGKWHYRMFSGERKISSGRLQFAP